MQLRNKSLLLGGSAYLHGDGLIVVCFHGSNFRSKSWALFNILQPNIEFSTEVQEIKGDTSIRLVVDCCLSDCVVCLRVRSMPR